MGTPIDIPAAFWKGLERAEFAAIVKRGGLNALECLRLWKMTARTDPCPTELQIFVKRADVMRLWP